MKNQAPLLSVLLILTITMSGCQAVEIIFKAGMIWGIILILLVIFCLLYLFNRLKRK